MVDEVITKQELIDAQKDAQSLDEFINGGDEQIVVTRLLKEYPTLANAIRQIYEKGGKFYPTLADANADIANIRTDVYIITGNNGAYYKATSDATSLTKSPYDPLEQAKADATTKANTAKSEAIAAAATDATTKANAAEVSAKSYVESTISGVFTIIEGSLINPNQDIVRGYYLSSGIYTYPPESTSQSYVTLEPIPIPNNRKFWAYGVGNLNHIQLLDINKSPLAAVLGTSIVNNVYTVPATAGANNKAVHYVRFGTNGGEAAIRNGSLAAGHLADGELPPSPFPAYGTTIKKATASFAASVGEQLDITHPPTEPSALNGKKWYAIGDSITANTYSTTNYCNVLAERHGATVVKYGTNGATVSRATGQPDNQIKSETYLEIPTDNPPDLITVALGTNDQSVHTVPLGVMTDRVNTTFYGALHVLLSGLRTRFPVAKIAYLAPIPRGVRYIVGDTSNKPYTKYKAIEEVCAYYSIPVWNGNTEFGFNPLDSATLKSTYMPDGLHPNDAGHEWFANRIEQFILSVVK